MLPLFERLQQYYPGNEVKVLWLKPLEKDSSHFWTDSVVVIIVTNLP